MLLILLYFLASIIIARYLSKKMKIASVVHSIFFIVITVFMLLICDTKFISDFWKNVFGEDSYKTLYDAISSKYTNDTFEINSIITLEFTLFASYALMLFIVLVKTIKFTLNIQGRKYYVSLQTIDNVKLFILLIVRKVKFFLTYCRLLN